jgi:hypothetical protein
MKNNCNNKEDGVYCTVHNQFIEAVQELKTSVRWIVVIGSSLFTLGLALAGMQYTQWQSSEKVHAQVQVNQALLSNHISVRHGL